MTGMFGTSDTDQPGGMRALITCTVCNTPIANVDTVGQQATVETDIRDCPDHPDATYTLSVERL
jgi:hypothetical protein